jgi:hypothetical protein
LSVQPYYLGHHQSLLSINFLPVAAPIITIRALRNVLIDNKEQEIYMNIEEHPGRPSEAMLLVDYDHDNAGKNGCLFFDK